MLTMDIEYRDESSLIHDFEHLFKKVTGKVCKVLVVSKLDQILRKMKVSEILDVVDLFRLPVMPAIRDSCRKRELVNLRKMFCLLAKKAGYSLATIGEELGERDHTTVIYNIRTAKIHLQREEDFKKLYLEIQEKIIELHEGRLINCSKTGRIP